MNWDDGRLLELADGSTATASKLSEKRVYSVFFRNPGNFDVQVSVKGKPGTTTVAVGAGEYAIVLVTATTTLTVSPQPPVEAISTIKALLGSVDLPTNSSGLTNSELTTGVTSDFAEYSRFYAVPPSSKHRLTVVQPKQDGNLVIVELRRGSARVLVLNTVKEPHDPHVFVLGGVPYDVVKGDRILDEEFYGDGQQFVWMNANRSEQSLIQLVEAQ